MSADDSTPYPFGRTDNPSSYIMELGNLELLRVQIQHDLLTDTLGLFPECHPPDLNGVQDILDLACGPGAWALSVAKLAQMRYPHLHVTGVDISASMLEYAIAQAKAQDLERYVAFPDTIDITSRDGLPFPDHSFDIVHARFLQGFMRTWDWLPLIKECKRLLRPGGLLRLMEAEWPWTNSEALERLHGSFMSNFSQAQRSFSPRGQNTGVTFMLARLLRKEGLRVSTCSGFPVDCSTDQQMQHQAFYQNYRLGLDMIAPWAERAEITNFPQLARAALEQIESPEFTCVWNIVLAVGVTEKSASPSGAAGTSDE